MRTRRVRVEQGSIQSCRGALERGLARHWCTTYTTLFYAYLGAPQERRFHFCDEHPPVEEERFADSDPGDEDRSEIVSEPRDLLRLAYQVYVTAPHGSQERRDRIADTLRREAEAWFAGEV